MWAKLFFIELYRNVSNMDIMSYLIFISSSWFGTDNITLYLVTCEGYVSFYKYSYLQGWLCIAEGAVIHQSYNPTENIGKQLRTSENISRTSKNIWYHPENNCGPIIDNLAQFEEDFNSPTKKWRWGGPVRLLSQTSPIPRSPDGDKNQCINDSSPF